MLWCGLIGFHNLKVHVQMVLEEVGDKLRDSAGLHGKFWYKCNMYPCICDWRRESDVLCGSHKSVLSGHLGKVSFFCYKNLIHWIEQQGFRWLVGFGFFLVWFGVLGFFSELRPAKRKKGCIFQLPEASPGILPKHKSSLIAERDQIIIRYTCNITSFPSSPPHLFSSRRCSHRLWLCFHLVMHWAVTVSMFFYDIW